MGGRGRKRRLSNQRGIGQGSEEMYMDLIRSAGLN